MRTYWFVPVIALAGIALHDHAYAAGPVVIPGVGPEQAMAMQPQMRRTAAPQGNLGGGFLEMLVTGQDPSASGGVIYARPPAPSGAYQQPMPRTAYAPAPQPGYGPMAAPRGMINPMHQRQEVDYAGAEKPGTIIVDTPSRLLYYVLGNGRALRYGIGVGRPGFEWGGVKTVSRKAEWPGWTPPPEMLLRRPDLPRHMEGGPENPLGARALYLGSSMYRIHGTNEPHTIGQNVSSGCIRMMNEDVVDLYNRARVGTKVVVI
jgi:lipoprotein-anchoring transpeptidase ErfK/SrfK